MKILIVDTYYPDFLKTLPFAADSTYKVELRRVLDYKFGTFDAYSSNLRKLGHECVDVVANHHELQQMWAEENCSGQGRRGEKIIDLQMEKIKPDVVFMQDLSMTLEGNRFNPPLLAGQLSCPWPGNDIVSKYQVLFTSFPHYLARIQALGVRAVYLPLAFEPSVLGDNEPERDIDVSFVGGVGRNVHWQYGTDVLECVAAEMKDRFHWYGYGIENLSESSPLRLCYRGQAWGKQMYDIYQRSRIVLNRHGEVSEGYSNNLRMFEATGCGALMMTELSKNLYKFFEPDECVAYESPEHAVELIKYYLDNMIFTAGTDPVEIAWRGELRTMREHTYEHRMNTVAGVLQEMLCPA